MPVPGYDVVLVDTPAPRGAPTATDTLFTADFATSGPLDAPVLVQSPDQADAIFGADPVPYSQLQATLDSFFAEGGARAWVQRVGGPAADDTDDDHANATPDDWEAALDKLPASLGPGQLVVPSLTTTAGHAALIQNGYAANRFTLLVPPQGATDAAVSTLAQDGITPGFGRFASIWRDYATVPSRAYGATRTVPWAVLQAGLMAANDARTSNPNLAAAGVNGISSYALGLVDEVTDARRETLRAAQVNTAKSVYGQVRGYGYRTLADLDVLPHWWDIGGARTVMAARALEGQVAEAFVFSQIDGRRQEIARYHGRLVGALSTLAAVGAVYAELDNAGNLISPGYSVDTGPTINTVDTIKAGELRARVALKTSPTAEHVVVQITRLALDQSF